MSTEETAIKLQTKAKMQIMDDVIKACALLKQAEHLAENYKALPELHAIVQNQIENDAQGELEYVFRVAIATMPYAKHKYTVVDRGVLERISRITDLVK